MNDTTSSTHPNSSNHRLMIKNCNHDMTACTFAIQNEDHTLGNVLRHVLVQNEHIEFAGYSVPHPSEPIVQIRVQTYNHPLTSAAAAAAAAVTAQATTNMDHDPVNTASSALQDACQTVSNQCDHVLNVLEQLLPYVKEDRIRMEKYYMEQNEDDDDNNDDDDDEVMMVKEED
jgi:DNA-directed RNA polymerases I and III subunit RPAC2